MRAEHDLTSFEDAADEYDAARPRYPDGLLDVLESRAGALAGKRVLDGGAGTGIASRQLVARAASVVALDPGIQMLLRARRRTAGLPLVVGDAAALPLRSGSVDLACFAQSWHWVAQKAGATEIARVLAPSGCWAAWWSHAWADGEAWFDRYCSLLEQRCPGLSRDQRNIEVFGEAITASPAFGSVERHIVSWQRQVSVDDWMIDLSSHSYIIALTPSKRKKVLAEVKRSLLDAFPDGAMSVQYETRLLLARHEDG